MGGQRSESDIPKAYHGDFDVCVYKGVGPTQPRHTVHSFQFEAGDDPSDDLEAVLRGVNEAAIQVIAYHVQEGPAKESEITRADLVQVLIQRISEETN